MKTIANFQSWDRIRWASDNEEPVSTSVQYRYGNDTNNMSPFTDEVQGVMTDKVGLQLQTSHRYIDIKINLYTEDTESEDAEGTPRGSTPIFYALELIANTKFELEEGDIPNSTGVIFPRSVEVDDRSCLSVLQEVFSIVNWEFRVKNKKLSIAETFGRDLTNEVMLRQGDNMEINSLGDDDGELVNILTAYGEGSGINRIKTSVTDNQSIEEYGEYRKSEQFDTNNLEELRVEAQKYVSANKHSCSCL